VQSNAGSITPRSGDLAVAGQTVTITQAGTVCSYSLQSTTGSAPAQGGSGTVGVVAAGACGWSSATNDPSWLTILSSGSGGTANVTFSALANPAATPRTGSLTIADIVYTVTQAPASCSYTLTPSSTTVADGSGSGSFSFASTPGGCTPTAVSYANWVTASVAGPATVSYTFAANLTASARSASIQVGNKTFTITQLGGTCGYSLGSYGALFTKAIGAGSVLGSYTAFGCPVVAGTDRPDFITLESPGGSPPIFTLPFSVLPYSALNASVRFGKIVIGGQVFIVKQTSW